MQLIFSIVIPFWNKTYELNLILKALALQDFPLQGFEVVLMDDGSDQPVAPLLERYRGILDIRYFKLERSANRARNRNLGVERSRGQYILFLDSDIVAEPDMLSRFHDRMRGRRKYVSVGFRNLTLDFDKRFLDEVTIERDFEVVRQLPARMDNRWLAVNFEKESGLRMLGRWQLVYTNCVVLSKQDFEEAGGFDEAFSKDWGAEDIELGYRLHLNGCQIEMNEEVNTYHLYHPENIRERMISLKRNYDYFLRKHPHWTVELFTREFETYAIEMIETQAKIAGRAHIVEGCEAAEDAIALLPERTLICGIEDELLISSEKVVKVFIPESRLRHPKIEPIIGIRTPYPEHAFELALVSSKYAEISFGLDESLKTELTRIAKRVIVVAPRAQDHMGLLRMGASTPRPAVKRILFLISQTEHFSFNKAYLNLALAADRIGMKSGYTIQSDQARQLDPNSGIMGAETSERKSRIRRLLRHGMDFVGDETYCIMDGPVLKSSQKSMERKVYWDELHYVNHEKEIQHQILPHASRVFLRREADRARLSPLRNPDVLPIGVDRERIEAVLGAPGSSEGPFTFLWADQFTNEMSNLAALVDAFQERFGSDTSVRLRILNSGNRIWHADNQLLSPAMNRIYSNNARYRHEMYESYFRRLRDLYGDAPNIRFERAELSEDGFTRELRNADCYVNLNSSMRLNPLVLESVALGKRPIILDNGAYDGYLDANHAIRIPAALVGALSGEPSFENIRLEERDNKRYYLWHVPTKEAIGVALAGIVLDRSCSRLDARVRKEFAEAYDWSEIAARLRERIS